MNLTCYFLLNTWLIWSNRDPWATQESGKNLISHMYHHPKLLGLVLQFCLMKYFSGPVIKLLNWKLEASTIGPYKTAIIFLLL